ncbi:ComF family protein [Salisediminibacterium beveridgei]|nr:phosphoribosyltransferase family protein [Salisediminibacterium beveridgei]
MLCHTCEGLFHRITHISCPVCGRDEEVLPHHVKQKNVWTNWQSPKLPDAACADCRQWADNPRAACVMNRSLYTYHEGMKDVMATYKYRGDATLATLFTKDLAKLARQSGADLFTTIPLAEDRLWERGFNQATLLSGALPLTLLLTRNGVTSGKQSKRTKGERLAHLENAFQLIAEPPELTGKTVCIIDDIYTTGATVRTAAKLLLAAGAKAVLSTTLIRA